MRQTCWQADFGQNLERGFPLFPLFVLSYANQLLTVASNLCVYVDRRVVSIILVHHTSYMFLKMWSYSRKTLLTSFKMLHWQSNNQNLIVFSCGSASQTLLSSKINTVKGILVSFKNVNIMCCHLSLELLRYYIYQESGKVQQEKSE